MKTILLSCVCFLLTAQIFGQQYSKCKIFIEENTFQLLEELGIPIDHLHMKKNHFIIGDFSQKDLNAMLDAALPFVILAQDAAQAYEEQLSLNRNSNCVQTNTSLPSSSNFDLGSMAGYFTYEEMLQELDEMLVQFPNLISQREQIGSFQTFEGRPIYALKISNNPTINQDKPRILYTSIHHAREPLSLSNTLFFMWYLLEQYAINDEIKSLIDASELYFVPMINPDGYVYNQQTNPNGGGMWRKNRRDNLDGNFGVDLNRNYSYDWGTTGISFDTGSDVYPGTSAFSEPETQAIKFLCEEKQFRIALNAHTYGNLFLFPIGSQTNLFAEDHDYFQSLGDEMTKFSGLLNQKSSSLYPASGDSDDYMYLMDTLVKPKIYAYTPEIGSDEFGFWPPENEILPNVQKMATTNLGMLKALHHYWTIKEVNPFDNLSTYSGNFVYNIHRLGLQDGPINLSIEALDNISFTSNQESFDLDLNEVNTMTLAYTIPSQIALGSEIKYVISAEQGVFSFRDTIVKKFGNASATVTDVFDVSTNWSGDWDLTTEDFYSASTSFTDRANANYANNTYDVTTFNQTIDLVNAQAPFVTFHAKWNVENNYDYVAFQVSNDAGQTWISQCGKYTNPGLSGNGSVQPNGEPIYDGVQNDWILEEISLSDYVGQQIKFRFILESDQGVTEEGFYVDDFKVFVNGESSIGNEKIDLIDFALYPNPVVATLSIQSKENLISIDVLDISGKTIKTVNIDGIKAINVLDMSSLNSGIYFVKCNFENNSLTKKIIKN